MKEEKAVEICNVLTKIQMYRGMLRELENSQTIDLSISHKLPLLKESITTYRLDSIIVEQLHKLLESTLKKHEKLLNNM